MNELSFQKKNIPFKRLATKVDCSRNAVWNIPSLKKWIDIISKLGYNTLLLYTEDTYEVDRHPYFGYGRGRYSKDELKQLDAYALEHGVELIPSIATLSHLATIFRWPQYAAILDTYDILLCEDSQTDALIDCMLSTCAECFTSRTIEINMDEAELLGRGKYLSKHGYEPSADIFQRHLNKVCDMARKHGFTTVLHSDGMKTECCTGAERWTVGEVFARNGFNPENNYSIEVLRRQMKDTLDRKIENMMVCFFGDDGGECSRFAGLPGLFYASEIAKGMSDESVIKQHFEEMFGISFDQFMLIDLTQRNETEEYGVHPSRYILYNDPFMGLLDETIPEYTRADHEQLVQLLSPLCDHPRWGYMFRTVRDLCAVTVEKCDIGQRIHAAYHEGDKVKLRQLADDLRNIRVLVETFYKSFRKQWMTENKGHGFDVSDVRIGGVVMRLNHCAERLEAYCAGAVDRIAELEDELLDTRTPLSQDYGKRKYLNYRDDCARLYCDIVSTNVLFKHRR